MTDFDVTDLYDSLFPDSGEHDDMDPGLLAINQMFNHLNFGEISKYYDLDAYNKSFQNQNDELLSIFHFNIRGAHNNKVKLESLLHSLKHQPQIIALTETWFTDEDKDNFFLDGYDTFHVVRDSSRGGSSILVRKDLNAELYQQFSFSNNEIEICTINLKVSDATYNVSSIYRPHSKNIHVKEFRNELSKLLKNAEYKKQKNILLGDLNINLLQHEEHQDTSDFLNMVQLYNYMPTITRPTRFPEGAQLGAPSLLDHVYLNFTPPLVSGILHYKISDHLPVFTNIFVPKDKCPPNRIKFRVFSQTNKELFTRGLCDIEWENILTHDNVNENFDLFYDKFSEIYERHFPIKTKVISHKRYNCPWLTSGLMTSIKTKNVMYKHMRMGQISELEYNAYRNRLTALIS